MLTRAALAAALGSGPGLAGPASAELYTQGQIDKARAAYAENVEFQLRSDMGIPAEVIRLEMPDRGSHPLSVSAHPATRSIRFPVQTIMFIDDFGILWTYLDRMGCEREYILTYLNALLREGRDLPDPLAAFGIDRDKALADPFVNDVSGKIVTTAVYFLLAHEVGHLALGHGALGAGAASIAQEMEADDLALAAFRAKGLPPIGVSFYFLAARWNDPARDRANSSTHPLSGDRIARIGEALVAEPEAFSHSEPDPALGARQVRSMGEDLVRVASRASEDGVTGFQPREMAAMFPLEKLDRACEE
jgi:hypothetical protein